MGRLWNCSHITLLCCPSTNSVCVPASSEPTRCNFSSDCTTTFITVQIPIELSYTISPYFITSQIIISEGGTDSEPFGVVVAPDNIHVVTECDNSLLSSNCSSIVTHADGTVVSAQAPAVPGEVVVIYAWGLGYTNPSVEGGELTPTPAPNVLNPVSGVYVRFDFNSNAAPKCDKSVPYVIAKAYLTPQQVGLYQVNVQLPATFPTVVPPCSSSVSSNLTINLSGQSSTDGAAICVQPPP